MKPISLLIMVILILSALPTDGEVRAEGPCGDTYIVVFGDTLSRIADRCDTDVDAILGVNPDVSNPDLIFPGQTLAIPDPEGLETETVQIFLIDEGAGEIGCGDAAVPVERTIASTNTPLTAAIQELLSIEERMPGDSGLSNALSDFDVHVETTNISNGVASIRLAGDFLIGGVCDVPRIKAQFEQTALQFPNVDQAEVFINGSPLDVILAQGPVVAISPPQGPPGTEVQTEVSLFEPNAAVDIGVGRQDSEFDVVAEARTDETGGLSTVVQIPDFAEAGERWVVVVVVDEDNGRRDPSLKIVSDVFLVTGDVDGPEVYVVEPGDTLGRIAAMFGTSVSAIAGANPDISNPDLIFVGQRLVIPEQDSAD